MGINNCLEFIRSKYPHLLKIDHISHYAYQRVIVDIASYIYKYACIYGLSSKQWTDAFVTLCLQFKRNRVHPIIVFDGKAPVQKTDEINDRREKKQQTQTKIKQLEECLEAVRNGTQTEEQYTFLFDYASKLEEKGKVYGTKRLLLDDTPKRNETLTSIQLDQISHQIQKLKHTVFTITPNDFQYMKTVLNAIGIPYLDAKGEAEDYCCFLVRKGFGSAVVSYDTDCIAHMATNIIFKFDPNSGEILHCNTDEIITEWKLTSDSIKDFAILAGCDYNRKNKSEQLGGAKVGPITAIDCLQTYGNIESIPGLKPNMKEITTIRSLFQIEYELDEHFSIPSTQPDISLCNKLITDGKMGESLLYLVEECFTSSKIKYHSGLEEEEEQEEEEEEEKVEVKKEEKRIRYLD